MMFLCWWCFWSKDQNVMMIMIDRSEYDDDDVAADWKVKVLKMLLFIEKSKCWRCCWSKGQNAKDVVADRKIKVLKMLLIESSKCWRCCCWSNQSKCWRCCWSKVQNAEDVVADRTSQSAEDVADQKGPSAEYVAADWKIKMLKILLMMKTEDWRRRLHDVEKLPMIYRCVTLLMLMMSPISTLVVVDVAIEYPSC